jgi:hypothetical protein
MDPGVIFPPSGLDRRVASLPTPRSTVSICPLVYHGLFEWIEGERADRVSIGGMEIRGIDVIWDCANVTAPPTGIFQQRFLSTSPARRIEAQSHVKGVPDWSAYQSSGKGENTRTLSYFMVGSLGVLAASGAKSTVSDILSNMAASADVLALAKIEVEMGSIPEGEFISFFSLTADRARLNQLDS